MRRRGEWRRPLCVSGESRAKTDCFVFSRPELLHWYATAAALPFPPHCELRHFVLPPWRRSWSQRVFLLGCCLIARAVPRPDAGTTFSFEACEGTGARAAARRSRIREREFMVSMACTRRGVDWGRRCETAYGVGDAVASLDVGEGVLSSAQLDSSSLERG